MANSVIKLQCIQFVKINKSIIFSYEYKHFHESESYVRRALRRIFTKINCFNEWKKAAMTLFNIFCEESKSYI